MHWFKRWLLKTVREKPVKRKGSKSSNFSSLICYTDQKKESPQPMSQSVQCVHCLQPHVTLTGDGSLCEEATVNCSTCSNDSKPPSATRHDLSRFSRCLLIDIYVHVYIYVRMYKTVSWSLPTRLDTVITTNSYVYVVRSHSMSVDLISHFTAQKIFNKSKRKKKKNRRTEVLP